MKLMLRHILLLCSFCLLLSACDTGGGFEFDPIPNIAIVNVAPMNVQEFQEIITIHLEYNDGDGDIGFEDPDVPSVFVKDSRLELYDEYQLFPLAPIGSNVPITGILEIDLKNLFVLGSGQSEQLTLDIYLVDRAGNVSNTVKSDVLTVNK